MGVGRKLEQGWVWGQMGLDPESHAGAPPGSGHQEDMDLLTQVGWSREAWGTAQIHSIIFPVCPPPGPALAQSRPLSSLSFPLVSTRTILLILPGPAPEAGVDSSPGSQSHRLLHCSADNYGSLHPC